MRFHRSNRREFITLLGGAAAWPRNGSAQLPPKRPLIALLFSSSKATGARYFSGFPQGMRELGYVEGRDYVLEDRYADGDAPRMPLLAKELVKLKPDVIVTGSTPAVIAAKRATDSIPIVGVNITDPVSFGLAASEARPGANVTGVLFRVEGLAGKLVDIALDLIPGIQKMGVLVDITTPASSVQRREVEAAAANSAVSVAPIDVRAVDEISSAIQTFVRERASIVVVLASGMFVNARRQIASFALASRLPTVCTFREHVEDGSLISYGVDMRQNFRRGAYFVDKILKGGKPGNLPMEFPTKVELVINATTAKAIGVTVPPTLLARADEVIE